MIVRNTIIINPVLFPDNACVAVFILNTPQQCAMIHLFYPGLAAAYYNPQALHRTVEKHQLLTTQRISIVITIFNIK